MKSVPGAAIEPAQHPPGEDRFQTLANVSPIGIFEADATGCCTFMNPVWESVCQQPVVNALGFGWHDVVHPDDLTWLRKPVTPKADPREVIEQEFRIVRPTGEVRVLRIRLGSVRSGDGAHVGWSGTFEDITEARRDADTLRWLRAYFERSPDVVLRLDAHARILDANPAAERMVGSAVASLRGCSSLRFGFAEPGFAAWCVAVSQVHESQQDQSLDVVLETAQGPREYAARLTAVADEDGNVEFVGAILRDVTERVRAEQELKTLQRQLLERDDRLQSMIGSLIGERAVLRDRAREWGIAALTPRERTILQLLARGLRNREIAEELGLSAGTVKNRIGLLLPKLGAADRTQAVAIALQLGLLADQVESPLPHFNLGDFE